MKLDQALIRPRLADFRVPRYWLAWLFLLFLRIFSLLPQRLTWLLGSVLGEVVCRLHRTTTIRTNIEMCFPEMNHADRRRLVRRYYRRLGQGFFDLGFAWMGSKSRLAKRVRISGREHYEAALAEGKGIILLAPHFVGLELGHERLSMEWPTAHMYRKPRDERLHQTLVYYRSRFGGQAFERYDSLKRLVKLVRQEQFGFYYLPDQDPDHEGKDYVFAPFFGIPTATYTALGRLARLSGARVIPCITVQLPYGAGYEVQLKPPLANFPTGDELEDTRRMNEEIEKGVLDNPDQYFWSYRRFKTRPDNAPSPYLRK